MTIATITGSSLDRAARCPASAALPQVRDVGEESWRDKGTAIHKFLERVAAVGRELALAEVDAQYQAVCGDIDLVKLADRLTLSTEVAMAYDWTTDTARILQPIEHRAYAINSECEVAGTIDLVGFDGQDAVYSGDYKGPHAWLPEPEKSMQLGLGAVALARIYGATRAHVEYIRIRDDGTVRRFDAQLDAFGIEAASEAIRNTMTTAGALRLRVLAGETPDVTEGPHCRYCPARPHCPAKTALIRKVVGDQPLPYLLPITPENATHAYQLLKKAKEAVSQIEGAIYSYAKLTPIDLGIDEDGSARVFGELRRPGNEVLDGAAVHAVMTEMYGGELANKVVTMEATKAAITNAVREVIKPEEKITKVVEKVYEAVRARGGSKRPETCTTTEFTVDPNGEIKARKKKAS